jgi:O-acetyl-ADP-ribose deacetylase (regulator of RNase III)
MMNVLIGDITKLSVDVIVNAANPSLLGGGGVDGVIHYAAGPELVEACALLPVVNGVRCKTGSAFLTSGFNLPCDYVIHTVGPVYADHTHDEAQTLLMSCYMNCIQVAVSAGCRSISFPAISTGVYGYPLKEAAACAVYTVEKTIGHKIIVNFVCFDDNQYDIYHRLVMVNRVSDVGHTNG